ncbi:MAG: DNA-3-methyladenine glycosylase [Planctomycetota bacterium]|nr:MAG: DNA-3-methyladenine glycosylase [Planctomycetota bacterium]
MSVRAGRPLERAFFRGDTQSVAEKLLGARLVHTALEGTTIGRIVEVEAYLAEDDPASHSARGPTDRNASMFLAPGHAYVYLIYGLHHCFNVVTARAGAGAAVLIRALEPLAGLELMMERRGALRPRDLCSGPGKLAQAMGLTRAHDGRDLTSGAIHLLPPEPGWRGGPVAASRRVGISKAAERELRYSLASCPWSSRP